MAITCVLYFVVHPKLKPFLAIIAAGAVLVVIGVQILAMTALNSDDFRIRRIVTWLDPENHSDTGGFQVMQGLYAIGSGGSFGKGLGNSTQKLGVIPEVQNDMILSIVCEELGVFGAIVILLLFGLLLYRLMFIARNAPDLYGSLLATGIFAHIALQVVLNIPRSRETISDPNDGSDTSVYQLWGDFHFVSDVGDGNCIGCIEEDQTPRHGKKLFSEIKKYGIFVGRVLKTT